ncbi:MAG: dihydroxy-acid dehydratase, partial [Acidobacteriota bacterium]|nr:dihydroxy-acid dehydratase [Acidobacteriota bacterium]
EFLMEEFFYAGGLPAAMKEILHLLHGDAITVTGKTIRENLEGAECNRREVIRTAAEPLNPEGGTVILRGNLAPDGAVIKQTAASPHLLQHHGKAYVFETYDQMRAEIDSDDLPVDKDTVLVMKGCGPKGAPGFPEWGHIPMPRVLLKQGVSDMVRMSDARMSGTSFGTVILHVAPESAIGGPLGVVRTGDEVELDVEGRGIDLCVAQEEIDRRLAAFQPQPPKYDRGYGRMFLEHVTQANLGCDFDFLEAKPR